MTRMSARSIYVAVATIAVQLTISIAACGRGRPTPEVGIPRQQKGVMLMNRIGPSASTLYVANADGSEEHELLATSGFGPCQ